MVDAGLAVPVNAQTNSIEATTEKSGSMFIIPSKVYTNIGSIATTIPGPGNPDIVGANVDSTSAPTGTMTVTFEVMTIVGSNWLSVRDWTGTVTVRPLEA